MRLVVKRREFIAPNLVVIASEEKPTGVDIEAVIRAVACIKRSVDAKESSRLNETWRYPKSGCLYGYKDRRQRHRRYTSILIKLVFSVNLRQSE